jgi:hypothetical protein
MVNVKETRANARRRSLRMECIDGMFEIRGKDTKVL